MAAYILGATIVSLGGLAPTVLEIGIWGVGQALYGAYWVVWGRNEPRRDEERLRGIIRDEMLAIQESNGGFVDVSPDVLKVKHDVVDDVKG